MLAHSTYYEMICLYAVINVALGHNLICLFVGVSVLVLACLRAM